MTLSGNVAHPGGISSVSIAGLRRDAKMVNADLPRSADRGSLRGTRSAYSFARST
jgi:hypothetical protein